MNENFVQTIQALNKQINYIKENGFPGLSCNINEVCQDGNEFLWKGRSGTNINPDCRRDFIDLIGEELLIKLPYAGTNLNVRLLFHLDEPWLPPGLTFNDKTFMDSILLKDLEEQVSSLDNWNPFSEEIISELLLQLHQLYKKYQLEILGKNEEILHFEYQSLLEKLKIGEEDVEILVSGALGSRAPASLLIRLPINLQDVPLVLVNENERVTITLLHLKLHRNDGSFTPTLRIASTVEKLIGSSEDIILPHVPPGSSLMDYVTRVSELLEQKVLSVVSSFEKRKQYVAQILCTFGGAVIEYNADEFTEVVLMLDSKDFNFLVIIKLPKLFPRDPLSITLQSLYFSVNKRPVKKKMADVNFSPSSSPEEMAVQTKNSILKFVPTFQSYSVSIKQG